MRAVLYRIGTHVCPSLANFWHLYKVSTLARNFLFGLFANDQTRTQVLLLYGMLRNEWKERGPQCPPVNEKNFYITTRGPWKASPALKKLNMGK